MDRACSVLSTDKFYSSCLFCQSNSLLTLGWWICSKSPSCKSDVCECYLESTVLVCVAVNIVYKALLVFRESTKNQSVFYLPWKLRVGAWLWVADCWCLFISCLQDPEHLIFRVLTLWFRNEKTQQTVTRLVKSTSKDRLISGRGFISGCCILYCRILS